MEIPRHESCRNIVIDGEDGAKRDHGDEKFSSTQIW